MGRKLLAVMLATGLTACTADRDRQAPAAAFRAPASEHPTRADFEAALAPGASDEARQALIERLPRVTFNDNGVTRVRYLWEGDMLLTRDQIGALLRSPPAAAGFGAQPELRLMLDESGRPAFWARGNRNLSYYIDQSSFAGTQQYETVAAAMATAAADWEQACAECALTIRRVADPAAATFKVQYDPEAVDFIAAAFFPNDPLYRRKLLVARDFYTSPFDRAGVLRHELGHVLGYRHEHIVGIRGCYREDNRWVAVTPYDSSSVMHYPCGGGGSTAMTLSSLDISGHRDVYSR